MKFAYLLTFHAILFLGGSGAEAHAFLDHAEPSVGSKIHEAPKEVKIWFTQKLVIIFSNLQVFDAGGREVDNRDKKLDPTNPALLSVSLRTDLKPGKYKATWRAVSVDSHVTNGDFAFELSP
jgi:methionine-rich copper-binding protein CopC